MITVVLTLWTGFWWRWFFGTFCSAYGTAISMANIIIIIILLYILEKANRYCQGTKGDLWTTKENEWAIANLKWPITTGGWFQ